MTSAASRSGVVAAAQHDGSHVSWLAAREPAAPDEIVACVTELFAAHAELGTLPRVDAFLAASELLLRRVLQRGGGQERSRANALNLLAADACVTYAFEAAADDPDAIPTHAERAVSRIAALAVSDIAATNDTLQQAPA